MKNLIKEWGIWSRHQGHTRHITPLYHLMRQHGCFRVGDYYEARITDEEALAVDKAVGGLRRDFLLLYRVLFMYYVLGWSYRQISRRYLTPLEYPHQVDMDDTDSRKRFVHPQIVKRMLEQAESLVYKNMGKKPLIFVTVRGIIMA